MTKKQNQLCIFMVSVEIWPHGLSSNKYFIPVLLQVAMMIIGVALINEEVSVLK